jgi:hypothetical protein
LVAGCDLVTLTNLPVDHRSDGISASHAEQSTGGGRIDFVAARTSRPDEPSSWDFSFIPPVSGQELETRMLRRATAPSYPVYRHPRERESHTTLVPEREHPEVERPYHLPGVDLCGALQYRENARGLSKMVVMSRSLPLRGKDNHPIRLSR